MVRNDLSLVGQFSAVREQEADVNVERELFVFAVVEDVFDGNRFARDAGKDVPCGRGILDVENVNRAAARGGVLELSFVPSGGLGEDWLNVIEVVFGNLVQAQGPEFCGFLIFFDARACYAGGTACVRLVESEYVLVKSNAGNAGLAGIDAQEVVVDSAYAAEIATARLWSRDGLR